MVVAWSSIPDRDCCGILCTLCLFFAAYASFFEPCDDATVDVAEQSDRAESRALRTPGSHIKDLFFRLAPPLFLF